MRPKSFQRECGVCKKKYNKYDLLRFCKVDNQIQYDNYYSLNGKGAYLCKECMKCFKEKKALNKLFRSNISQEINDKISNELRSFDDKKN